MANKRGAKAPNTTDAVETAVPASPKKGKKAKEVVALTPTADTVETPTETVETTEVVTGEQITQVIDMSQMTVTKTTTTRKPLDLMNHKATAKPAEIRRELGGSDLCKLLGLPNDATEEAQDAAIYEMQRTNKVYTLIQVRGYLAKLAKKGAA